MTIPPVPATPAPAGAAPGAPSSASDSGGADHFHALVERHLGSPPAEPRQPAPRPPERRADQRPPQPVAAHRTRAEAHPKPGNPAGPRGATPVEPKPSAPNPGACAPGTSGPATDPTAAPAAGGQVMPTATAAPVQAPAPLARTSAPPTRPADPTAAPVAGTQALQAASVPGSPTVPAGTRPPAGPLAAGPLGPAAALPAQSNPTGPQSGGSDPAPLSPASAATGAVNLAATGQAPVERSGSTAGGAGRGTAEPAETGPAPSIGSAPAGALPLPASTGSLPGAVAGGTPAPQTGAAGSPVLDQMLSEVPRMVSRGDGTHRLTLKLHPADLGELRLTVTVKNGAVDVTVAAGRAAREALRDGSPELRSLLQLTGHTAGQLVIRDLPGTGAAPAATQAWATTGGSNAQPGGDQQATTFGQHGEPRQQHGSQAGRPEFPGHRGRDGSGQPDREPPPLTHPATRGGTAAVDVRI